MNFLSDAYNSTVNFFSNAYDNLRQVLGDSPNSTEGADLTVNEDITVAPFNIHPIDFDITSKPLEEMPQILEILGDGSLPPDLDGPKDPLNAIVSDLLNSFTEGPYVTTKADSANFMGGAPTETVFDIPEEDGHTFIRVLEDSMGESIEFIHEYTETEITPTTEKVTEAVSNVLNSTINGTSINKEPKQSEESYINMYIIIALALVIILYLSVCGIWWFRKNRLRAEKRNAYPVMSVTNGEYMDPSIFKNNEKEKQMNIA